MFSPIIISHFGMYTHTHTHTGGPMTELRCHQLCHYTGTTCGIHCIWECQLVHSIRSSPHTHTYTATYHCVCRAVDIEMRY